MKLDFKMVMMLGPRLLAEDQIFKLVEMHAVHHVFHLSCDLMSRLGLNMTMNHR